MSYLDGKLKPAVLGRRRLYRMKKTEKGGQE